MRSKSPIHFIVVGFLAALAPLETQAKDFYYDYQRMVPTGYEAELEIEYISGDLTVTTYDGDQVIIDARKRVNAVNMDEAALVADHIEIKVEHQKKKVRVTTNYLRMRNRSQSFWSKVLGTGGENSYGDVTWNIQVPVGCQVKIVNTSGTVSISNVIGDVDIRTSAGEINLTSIEGRINVDNSSGTTFGELLFGPVTVAQAQGTIDLQFVEGDIKIKSSTANINVRQDRGSIDLVTSAGKVDIQTTLASDHEYFIETESGDISLSIPETSSGDIRIESQAGEIKTEIPIAIKSMTRKQVEGSFGFGGVKINLTSISGDVTVAQF